MTINELSKIITENIQNEMKAYHGSASDFDKFDSSFMGNGEGAQSYGWGHYVTTNLKTAKHFAEVAQTNGFSAKSMCNGVSISNEMYSIISMSITNRQSTNSVDVGEYINFKLENMIQSYNTKKKTGSKFELMKLEYRISDYKKTLKFLNSLGNQEIKGLTKHTDGRIIYEVDIPEDNDKNYISWNKTPKQILNFICYKIPYLSEYQGCFSFGDLYEAYIKSGFPPKKLSYDLYRIGFKGIRVPIGYMSGGGYDGFNYVIFNDNDISIIEKYDVE